MSSFQPVAPRVYSSLGEKVLLTDVIGSFLESKRNVLVALDGFGIATAFSILKKQFESVATVIQPQERQLEIATARSRIIVRCDLEKAQDQTDLQESYRLTPWGTDEFIEYLLSNHPEQCRSVLSRIPEEQNGFAQGCPLVWQPILTRMSSNQDLTNPFNAVLNIMSEPFAEFRRPKERFIAEIENQLLNGGADWLSRVAFSDASEQLLESHDVIHLLCGYAIANDLAEGRNRFLTFLKRPGLKHFVAYFLKQSDKPWAQFLDQLLHQGFNQAEVAELHLACNPAWQPPNVRGLRLVGADLSDASWPGCLLRNANLSRARLDSADLRHCNLKTAKAYRADLSNANLNSANLSRVDFREANLNNSLLVAVKAIASDFSDGDLYQVDLSSSELDQAKFHSTDLSRAMLRSAQIRNASFLRTILLHTNFEGTDLSHSLIVSLDFREALLERTNFAHCGLQSSNFEGLDLTTCNFTFTRFAESLLTGTTAKGVDFSNTSFRHSGLAEIHWQGCNLSRADFSGVSFHLGSTRCGHVDSPYPSHGTRTGFYTDDYDDLHYQAPEVIRKAALVDCDLSAANLFETDFYLVDLRGSKLSTRQLDHVRRCGAIL